MPAALDVNWTEIQMLALTVGVREAARQMGISEDAVMKRSSREGWISDRPASVPPPPTMVVREDVSVVRNAAEVLRNVMKEDALGGRAAALKVTRRALERANRYHDDELMVPEVAQTISTYVKSAATAGGYAASDAVVKMNLQLTGSPAAIEAEIVAQDAQSEELP